MEHSPRARLLEPHQRGVIGGSNGRFNVLSHILIVCCIEPAPLLTKPLELEHNTAAAGQPGAAGTGGASAAVLSDDSCLQVETPVWYLMITEFDC